jgi:predicted transcriptional regulator
MSKCWYCGQKISNKFENSVVPLSDLDRQAVNVPLPKVSSTVETLVTVPLLQSSIYGVFIGVPSGLVIYGIIPHSLSNKLPAITIIGSAIILATAIAWSKLSPFFNSLLTPSEPEIEYQEPIQSETIYSIQQEDKDTWLRGNISATDKQKREWARLITLDLTTYGPSNVNLTQSRFAGNGKIFSQPAYKKFTEDLMNLGLIKKGQHKNSPYTLTRAGLKIIENWRNFD